MVYSKEILIKYGFLLVIIVLVLAIPEDFLFSGDNTICLHYHFLGFECPLCGLTRSAWSLMHLNFFEAIQFNFNSVSIMLYLIFDIMFIVSRKGIFSKLRKVSVYGLVIGLCVIYIYRITIFLQTSSVL